MTTVSTLVTPRTGDIGEGTALEIGSGSVDVEFSWLAVKRRSNPAAACAEMIDHLPLVVEANGQAHALGSYQRSFKRVVVLVLLLALFDLIDRLRDRRA